MSQRFGGSTLPTRPPPPRPPPPAPPAPRQDDSRRGPDAYERERERRIRAAPHPVRWPYRSTDYLQRHGGYVVWRDVFEGAMRCTLEEAIDAHRVATFVCEADARDYAAYRNEATALLGTDDVYRIHPAAHPPGEADR